MDGDSRFLGAGLSHGQTANSATFLSVVARARASCESRLMARAADLAIRLEGVLGQFRARQGFRGASPALISVALDRFVGEARAAAEVSTGLSHVPAVEDGLASLEHMFVASEQALSVGTMQPSSFMPGAEAVAAGALRALRDLSAPREQEITGEKPDPRFMQSPAPA